MLKKTITYTDYNGIERKEDFLFNLSEAELAEMLMTSEGDLAAMLTRIVEANDGPALTKTFKNFILKAYGEKSADGRRFMKSEEISTAFAQTEAYSQLFMELATNDKAAAEFINGIVPAKYAEQAAKMTPALESAK